jgi:hypothetical protein
MAAIISQLAANKRARAKRIKNTIPIDKSVYLLPPFDPSFDPTGRSCFLAKFSKDRSFLHVLSVNWSIFLVLSPINLACKLYHTVHNKYLKAVRVRQEHLQQQIIFKQQQKQQQQLQQKYPKVFPLK